MVRERKRVENTKIRYHEELALEKGRKLGEKSGEKRGLKKGLEQGKLETAKTLLKDNIPISKVVQYTGLSEKQVRKLC